ncbi:MAG: helix-hairpin-helix domain-containing protein [Verrucomicrobiales bacterium]|nr:helix-hairpin-helix domain-containing protein [Verrucomicrobiales bacterium]
MLILQRDQNWGIYLATLGLFLGVSTAFILWYRSARLISILEGEQADLRKGDIFDGGPFSAVKSSEKELVEKETVTVEEETAPEISVTSKSEEDEFLLPEIFDKAPDDADDLTLLEGINEEKAQEMREAGIYKFSQLEGLSEEDRRKFGFKFGWSDINWGAWGATAAAAAGVGAVVNKREQDKPDEPTNQASLAPVGLSAPKFDTAEKKEDSSGQITIAETGEKEDEFQLKTTFKEEPEDADDLTAIEGINEAKAAELRKAGIYKFSQIEELNEEERTKLGRKFNFSDVNWGTLGALGAGAVGAGILVGDKKDEDEGAEKEDEFQLKTESDEEPEDLTSIEEIDNAKNAETATAEAEIFAGGKEDEKEAEEEFQLITIFDEEPEDADDLTAIEGIDEAKAAELRKAGIYKFSQLEELDEVERTKLGRKFNLPDIKWGTLGALGAGVTGAAMLAAKNEEQESAKAEIEETESGAPEISAVYTAPPEDADDLTLLEGIDEEKAAALREAGIYKFSQLEDLDEDQRESFGEKFNWPDLDWGKWAALGTAGAVGATLLKGEDREAEEEPVSPTEETRKIRLSSVPGEVKPDWTWGYTFKENPDEADDLTQIEGISSEDAARLNAEGIYTVKQLEALPGEKREEVKTRFGWSDIDWGKWSTAGAAAGAGVVAGVVAAGAVLSDEEETAAEDTASVELPAEVKDRKDVNSDWTWGYTFNQKPDDADDLTQMEGVTAEDAAELNRQGVYTFKQLENLPEEKREEIQTKFGWSSIDWGKWGTLAAAGAVAGSVFASGEDEEASFENDTSAEDDGIDTVTLDEDPAAVWDAASSKLAAQSGDLDTTEKYGELALSEEDFTSRLEADFNNESVEVHPRYGIIYSAEPDSIDDFTKIRGIGLATEKQLYKSGVYKFKQIASWNAGAIEGISTDLNLGTRVRDDDWVYQAQSLMTGVSVSDEVEAKDSTDYDSLISSNFSGENVEYKKGLGILYNEAPENSDDLSEIKGIGNSIEEKLNEYGVYKFGQLAGWNESNISAFNDRLSFKGRIEREEWVQQAQKLAARAEEEADYQPDTSDIPVPDVASYDGIVSEFSGEDVEVDPALGVIYQGRPERSDDLKQIWGIGSRIEKAMHSKGVYRFSQIAAWNEYNIRQFDERLDLKGRIQRDHWVSQSQSLAKESDELHTQFGSLLSSRFAGESVTVKPRYGVVYTQSPEEPDDLTEINGIGPVTERQLNDSGIYTFKQIANWDGEAIKAVEEDIDGPGRVERDKWVEQAAEFDTADGHAVDETEPEKPDNMVYLDTLDSFDGENVDIDDRFGVVYTGRPTQQDDLKRIRGVGKFLEKQLNDRGVYRFKQISNWNDYNIWAFGKDLAFPGRIAREKWVSQAAELSELEEYRSEAEEAAKTKYADKDVKIDPELGVIYSKKPESYDDLTRLEGIDQDAAGRLNSAGIYTFDQINSLKGPQRKSFTSRFNLGDIDWAKWSGISAIGAIAAGGAAAVGTVKEEVSEIVADKTKPVKDKVEQVSEVTSNSVKPVSDLPDHDEPKGIFGTGDEGDGSEPARVVYIMDVSRSLTPAQLQLSKMELRAAVSALSEGSLYQVIFFSGPTWFAHQRMVEGGARGEDVVIADGDEKLNWSSGFGGFEYERGNENLPGGEWREATPENIASTLEDIEVVGKSYGTTWHLPLTMAMNLEPAPKNIYFLTDGETARQDQVAEDMVEMAQSRGNAKLNTIALMVPGASVPLHRMASGTGGEYSLVIAGGKVLKDDALREYLDEKDITLND